MVKKVDRAVRRNRGASVASSLGQFCAQRQLSAVCTGPDAGRRFGQHGLIGVFGDQRLMVPNNNQVHACSVQGEFNRKIGGWIRLVPVAVDQDG